MQNAGVKPEDTYPNTTIYPKQPASLYTGPAVDRRNRVRKKREDCRYQIVQVQVITSHIHIQKPSCPRPKSKNLAPPPLLNGHKRYRATGPLDGPTRAGRSARPGVGGSLCFEVFPVVGDDGQDGLLEDLLDARHLLATALHVGGAHLARHREALFCCDGCEALGLEHVDAGLLVAQVGLEADEDEGRVRTEVQDFGVPLCFIRRLLGG